MKWAWGLSLFAHLALLLALLLAGSNSNQKLESPSEHSSVSVTVRPFAEKAISPSQKTPGTKTQQDTRPDGLGEAKASRPPTPGPPSEPSRAAALPQIELLVIQERIAKNLTYPSALQRQKIEGSLFVQIEVSPIGALVQLQISESSGNPVLDRLALRAVEKSAPFPEAAQNKTGNLVLRLPVSFKINKKSE